MKTKYLTAVLTFFLIITLSAQTNLNNFKYVIVPKKFDFLKKPDQFQLNSMTKFLLEKENFKTIFDDEDYPEDMAKDRCLALEANVIDESGLFKTKLVVQLKDCNNTILFVSRTGDSKLKEYQKAYYEALREAFQSFQALNYVYKPKEKDTQVVLKPAIKLASEDTPEVKSKKEEVVKKVKAQPKIEPAKPEMQEAPKKEAIVIKDIKNPNKKNSIKDQTILSDILYAQTIPNGFQLVDSSPKVVYTIYYSGKKDIYMVKGIDAVIYKLNDTWVIAEQKGDKLDVSSINIKF